MSDDGPYVGLDYFREADAGRFFGRDTERRLVIANLRATRLTLLTGPSGVGKSSLLRAGVAARLREHSAREDARRRFVPIVYSAWRGDPQQGLIAALAEHADVAHADGLEAALEHAATLTRATPLIILDEFQDWFQYADGNAFDAALARCVNRDDLRAHFLIAVREDAYAQLGQRFKGLIANVYANYLQLESLDTQAARETILEPLAGFNTRAEPALVDRVVADVRREDGHVEAAFLQLVMRRVWEAERAAGSELLRVATLDRLGGADTIVRAHLDDALATLTPAQQNACAEALRFFVTAGGRKIALTDTEVLALAEVPAEVLAPALDQLQDQRIFRRVRVPGADSARELFHDILAPAVLDWRRRHAEGRRLAGLQQRNQRLAAAVVLLLAALVAVGAYAINPDGLRKLELGTVDARVRLSPAAGAHPDVALVGMDDRTVASLADAPLREGYAELISKIDALNPRAIAVDVRFDNPDAQGSQAILDALSAAHVPVVLAFATFTAARSGTGELQLQVPLLQTTFTNLTDGCNDPGTNTWLGYAGLPEDADGRERRLEATTPATPELELCTFPVTAVQRTPKHLDSASRRAWAGQTDQTAWIDFRGPPGTFAPISARSILDGGRPDLRDKVVVIGSTQAGVDLQRTPYSQPMVGAEVQANAIATLLDDVPLRDVPMVVDLLAILAMAAVAPLAALRLRRWIVAPPAAGVLYVLLAWLAFEAGWVLAVVAPLIALAIATVGTAIAQRVLGAASPAGEAARSERPTAPSSTASA